MKCRSKQLTFGTQQAIDHPEYLSLSKPAIKLHEPERCLSQHELSKTWRAVLRTELLIVSLQELCRYIINWI